MNSDSQAGKHRRRPPARENHIRRLRLERLEDRLAPATHTWTGNASNQWSANANWDGGSPAGDNAADIVFPSSASNRTNNNDISDLTINSIRFAGIEYQIQGSEITLNGATGGGITVNPGAGRVGFYLPINLARSQTLTVGSDGVLDLLGMIRGPGAVTEAGEGVVGLEVANNYAGGTILSGGALGVYDDHALGTGFLALLGGTLRNNITPVTLANPLFLAGSSTIADGGDFGGNFTFTGNGILSGGNTLSIYTRLNSVTTFNGNLIGPGSIAETGPGKLVLAAANTYTGTTTVSAGTLQLTTPQAIPATSAVLVAAQATLDLMNLSDTIGSLAGAGTVKLGSGALTTGADNTSTIFSGLVSGLGGSFAKKGTGIFELSGANAYTGGTKLTAGTLIVDNDSGLGSGPLLLEEGTLQAGAAVNLSNPFTVSGNAAVGGDNNVTFSRTGNLSAALTVTNTGTTTFSAALGGNGGLEVAAESGTVVLSVANSYSGGTVLDSGSLTVGDSASLGTAALTLNGGTVQSTGAFTLANAFTVAGAASVGGSNNLILTGLVSLLSASISLAVSDIGGVIFQGGVTGPGGLTVAAGTGIVVLPLNDSYGGITTLNSGTLIVGNNSALGQSTLALNGGIFQANATMTSLPNTFAVRGPATIAGSNILTFAGPGTLSAGATLTVANSGTTTFTGVLDGGGNLTESDGAGTLMLSAPNRYSGTTAVNSGTLRLGINNAIPSTSAVTLGPDGTIDLNNLGESIGSLDGAGNIINLGTGTLTVGSSSIAFSGTIQGMGLLRKTSLGILTMVGNSLSFNGTVELSGGTLVLGSSLALGFAKLVLDGGTIQVNANTITVVNQLLVNGPATVGGTNSIVFAGSGTLANGTLTIKNTAMTTFAAQLNGGGSLTVDTGLGSVMFSAAQIYSGATTINTGTLRQMVTGALSPASPLVMMAPGTLDLNNYDARIIALTGAGTVMLATGTVGSATLTTGSDDPETIYSGVIGGRGNLRKEGSGKLSLLNSSTYLGTTVVHQGTLQLAADHTLAPSSSITIDAGATLDINNGQNDISSITGPGSLSFSGGTANISGTYDLTGSPNGTQVIGGVVNFLGSVINLGGVLNIGRGGQAVFSTKAPILVPRVILSDDGSMFGGSDSITVNSEMDWTGGTMNGSGSINFETGSQGEAQLFIDGPSTKYVSGSWTVTSKPSGHIIWMGTGGIKMSGKGSAVNNQGLFETGHGKYEFGFNGNPDDTPQITNIGTFSSGGTIIVDPGITFNNSGGVQISGTLNIEGNYTVSQLATLTVGGTVNIDGGSLAVFGVVNGNLSVVNAGTLYGYGMINGSVTNAGEIDPGDSGTTGVLMINGDYTQAPEGKLNIRIGATGYDQLIISGMANLDGRLNASLLNGFMPDPGVTFQILTFNSLKGAFSSTGIDPFMLGYGQMGVTLQA